MTISAPACACCSPSALICYCTQTPQAHMCRGGYGYVTVRQSTSTALSSQSYMRGSAEKLCTHYTNRNTSGFELPRALAGPHRVLGRGGIRRSRLDGAGAGGGRDTRQGTGRLVREYSFNGVYGCAPHWGSPARKESRSGQGAGSVGLPEAGGRPARAGGRPATEIRQSRRRPAPPLPPRRQQRAWRIPAGSCRRRRPTAHRRP